MRTALTQVGCFGDSLHGGEPIILTVSHSIRANTYQDLVNTNVVPNVEISFESILANSFGNKNKIQMISFVWFELVNDQGQPYQGSTPTSVSISQGLNVDSFRKQVKTESPQIPSSIGAAQLIVYKNKSDLIGEDEISPLKGSTLIDPTFGPDEDHSLIVVVPIETAGTFSICVDKLANSLVRATTSKNVSPHPRQCA